MVIGIKTTTAYGGCRLNRRRHKGTFWSDKYVLYLACGAGFMDVHIYQN